MTTIYRGIRQELAIELRDEYHLRVFIETGTNRANTTIWAAQYFQRVYSIENWKPYYEAALSACKDYRNIKLILGDSRYLLKELLGHIFEPALFWLDAHWVGDKMTRPDDCPLLDELNAIIIHPYKHILMIDDANFFNGDLPKRTSKKIWPKMKQIKEKLVDFDIEIKDNMIIAIPHVINKER